MNLRLTDTKNLDRTTNDKNTLNHDAGLTKGAISTTFLNNEPDANEALLPSEGKLLPSSLNKNHIMAAEPVLCPTADQAISEISLIPVQAVKPLEIARTVPSIALA